MVAFPSVADGEPVVISATTYRTYCACPEQALARMRGEFPAETRASFKGGLAHRVFARHLRDGEIETDRFEQVCREEIGSGLNAKLGPVGLAKPSLLAPVIAEVGELYQRFKRLPTAGFRGAEAFVEVEPQPGVTLRGAVDAIFDDPEWGVRLVDWKTGAALGGADDQLDFYAFLWTLQHHTLPGRVEAVSVVTGERRGITPSDEALNETAFRLAELVSSFRSAFASGNGLPRIGGPWCSYCPLLEGCGEGAAAVELSTRA